MNITETLRAAAGRMERAARILEADHAPAIGIVLAGEAERAVEEAAEALALVALQMKAEMGQFLARMN